MAIQKLTLKQSLGKNILAIMPIEEEKNTFSKHLVEMVRNLKNSMKESEEFQKNIVSNFLKKMLPENFINTKDRTDLAIYGGRNADNNLKVIIEFKSLSNKIEMMNNEKINTKALQEIIHYYMRERNNYNNLEIRTCIITNGLSWFTIDAKEIEKFFIKNKEFNKLYTKWTKKQLASDKTDFLYKYVIAPSINDAIEKGIRIAHFDLENALIENNKEIKIKENYVTNLYRYFSAENLLAKEIFSDSNKLNKVFYDELLYLMGLEEVKIKGAKANIIQRLSNHQKQQGSLMENTIDRLINIKDLPEELHFETAMQLSVTWINRILFIKLLESQLVTFNKNEQYKILTKDKIKTFEDLYDLFFGILAKKNKNRSDRLSETFSFIPYLNSSLFEETFLELDKDAGIGIDRLRETKIAFYKKTVLKDINGKRKEGKVDFLEYLFEFLESYDFSTAVRHKKNAKNNLINASVLGLIFEKINGYNEGSFYTPGRITMYMAKESLNRAIINKINKEKNWNCENFDHIKFNIGTDINVAKEISEIIDSMKICDPAVGSGHFLVSVLNELIAIKSELKVLFNTNGESMANIRCKVVNDELIIQDVNGDNYIYMINNKATNYIQEAIFNEKRKIIENCLFGVDINQNSVNICRLRLWIELLKHAYYYFDENEKSFQLTTLPNIDINIKVGNSLVYQYNFDIGHDNKKSEYKEYIELVKKYKTTNDKKVKKEIEKNIKSSKINLSQGFNTPAGLKHKKISAEYQKLAQLSLFEVREEERLRNEKLKDLKQKIEIIEIEISKSRNNPFYKNSLEWRIEFPEILDENGEFEGFDLIIGNPPYIFARNKSFTNEDKEYFIEKYKLAQYQINTYHLFIELAWKLLKEGGTFTYIVPNNILTIQSNSIVRDFLVNKTGNLLLINCLDKVFEDANVDNSIVLFDKVAPNLITLAEMFEKDVQKIDSVRNDFFGKNPIFSLSKVRYKELVPIYKKMEDNSSRLKNIAEVKAGIQAYEVGKGTPKITSEMRDKRIYHSMKKEDATYRKYLQGEDVRRYEIKWSGEWIKYGKNLAAMRKEEYFEEPRILVRQIPQNSIYSVPAMLCNSDFINDRNSMIIRNMQLNPYYILGIINSKLMTIWFVLKYDKFQRGLFPQFKVNELEEFPIPIDKTFENEIAKTVNEMIKSKDKDQKEQLNLKIDELVMKLFKLSNSEKDLINEFMFK